MKPKYVFTLVFAFALICLAGSFATAQEKMEYAVYLEELAKWQDREDKAKVRIAELEKEIAALEARLADLNKQIEDTQRQIYDAMQMNDRDFRNYLRDLERLRDQIRGMLNLSPGDLYRRKDEAAGVEDRFEDLKSKNAARHPDAAGIVREIESLLSRLMRAIENAAPPFDVYEVVKGDHLWGISKKPDIYSDPYQWLKLWTKNRELVKNPDLIYPGWSLKVPRGIADEEYLVERGDNLTKIAKKLYNDPFKWNALFEANSSVISDKNVIYPYMILIKP